MKFLLFIITLLESYDSLTVLVLEGLEKQEQTNIYACRRKRKNKTRTELNKLRCQKILQKSTQPSWLFEIINNIHRWLVRLIKKKRFKYRQLQMTKGTLPWTQQKYKTSSETMRNTSMHKLENLAEMDKFLDTTFQNWTWKKLKPWTDQ